jgi:excisionase family DNA binding protein
MVEGIMTVSQAAAYKGVPEYVIRNAIRGKSIPADKDSGAWLIKTADLDAWEPRERGRPRLKKRGRPKKSI